MPKLTAIRVQQHKTVAVAVVVAAAAAEAAAAAPTTRIIMRPTTMACVQMVMGASIKWPTRKCASFALKLCIVNCIALTIHQKQISPTKPSKSMLFIVNVEFISKNALLIKR